MFLGRRLKGIPVKGETGGSLLETIVALALLGCIGVAFLGALATGTNARSIADEHASARILAESQMEDLKKQPFISSYTATASLLADYPGYSIPNPQVVSLGNGIQKITVTVRHRNKDVHTLENYKVDR